MSRDPDGFPAHTAGRTAAQAELDAGSASSSGDSEVNPTIDELRRMTPREVNRFLASRGVSIRVRDDQPDRPTAEMSAPPADDPPPVPRRPWGCATTWALLLLAVWVVRR